MKITKFIKSDSILKGFIVIFLSLSFVSCSKDSDNKEVFNVVSTDSELVLRELIERGYDTSSWNGIYYVNNIDDSIGNESEGYTTYEHILERTIASDLEGLITCINDIVIYIEGYSLDYWSEWEYYDGSALYGNYFGEFEKEKIDLSLEYIMSYPLLVLEASIEKFTIYSGLVSLLESLMDVTFSGYIETSNLGNTNICIRIDENYIESDGEDIIYGTDYAENVISYNIDNEIIEINYTAGDLYTYTGSDYFIKSEQTLTIKEYNKKLILQTGLTLISELKRKKGTSYEKGSKLLIMPMCLLLSLGACTEPEEEDPGEVYTVVEDDVDTVYAELASRGVDTTNWQGYWYANEIDEYLMYGFNAILLESIIENVIYAESEGVVTALEEYIIDADPSMIDGFNSEDYSEVGYYDGTTLYYNTYGSIFSTPASYVTKETFTSYPQETIEYCVEQYTDFIGFTDIMATIGYYFSGTIATSDLGNTKISAKMEADYTYEDDGVSMDISGYMLLEVTYDEDGNFTNLYYTVQENDKYDDGSEYLLTQTLVCHDYLEDRVPEPDWLDTYFPNR